MATETKFAQGGKVSALARAKQLEGERAEYIASLRKEAEEALSRIADEDREIVRIVLSRFIGPLTDQSRSMGYTLSKALCGIARTTVDEEWIHGEVHAPARGPIDNNAPSTLSAAKTRMRKAGIKGTDISEEWLTISTTMGRSARLDDVTLAATIAPVTWPYVAALMKEGPDAILRRTAILMQRRAAEGISGPVLDSAVRAPIARLVAQWVESNGRGYPHSALKQWRAKISLPSGGSYAEPAETCRETIPRDLVRRVMRPWFREMEEKTDGGRRLPSGYFRSLRMFLFAAIMLATGSRYGAMRSLAIKGYDPCHVFPDGECGPAVQLTIGKQKSGKPILRWKAIPPPLAPYMDLYMDAANLRKQPEGWPFWIGTKYPDHAPDDPTLIPDAWTAYDAFAGKQSSYEDVLARKRKRVARNLLEAGASAAEIAAAVEKVTTNAGRALFPIPDGKGPWDGHSPHLARHYANNALAWAAEILLERPEGAELRGAIDPYAAAHAVLDQAIGKADPLGYGVAKSAQSREKLSRLLVPIAFELMVGDAGAPKGIDAARVSELKSERRSLMQLEEDLHTLLEGISRKSADERAAAQAQMTKNLPVGMSAMSPAEVWRLSQERSARVTAMLDEIERRADEQRNGIQRQLRACEKESRRNERDLVVAETTEVPLPEEEERTWIPIADPHRQPDAGSEIEDEDVEWSPAPPVQARSRVTLREWARLIGKHESTVRKYLNPDYLEKAPRIKGIPWTPNDLRQGRVLISESARRRYINTDDIDRLKLTMEQQQELIMLLAQAEPRS